MTIPMLNNTDYDGYSDDYNDGYGNYNDNNDNSDNSDNNNGANNVHSGFKSQHSRIIHNNNTNNTSNSNTNSNNDITTEELYFSKFSKNSKKPDIVAGQAGRSVTKNYHNTPINSNRPRKRFDSHESEEDHLFEWMDGEGNGDGSSNGNGSGDVENGINNNTNSNNGGNMFSAWWNGTNTNNTTDNTTNPSNNTNTNNNNTNTNNNPNHTNHTKKPSKQSKQSNTVLNRHFATNTAIRDFNEAMPGVVGARVVLPSNFKPADKGISIHSDPKNRI